MIRGILDEGPALPLGATDEISLAIEQALRGLPPRRREVAERRLRHQQETDEIAVAMGISPQTVNRHLGRVAVRLRCELPKLLR